MYAVAGLLCPISRSSFGDTNNAACASTMTPVACGASYFGSQSGLLARKCRDVRVVDLVQPQTAPTSMQMPLRPTNKVKRIGLGLKQTRSQLREVDDRSHSNEAVMLRRIAMLSVRSAIN